MKHPRAIKYIIIYIIGLILNLFFFSYLYKIEIGQNVVLAAMGMALIVPLLVWSQSQRKLHFGNTLGIFGLIIIIEAGLPLLGNLNLPAVGKAVWWLIPDPQTKLLLAGATIFGIIIFLINLRAMMANWIILRPGGKSKF